MKGYINKIIIITIVQGYSKKIILCKKLLLYHTISSVSGKKLLIYDAINSKNNIWSEWIFIKVGVAQ